MGPVGSTITTKFISGEVCYDVIFHFGVSLPPSPILGWYTQQQVPTIAFIPNSDHSTLNSQLMQSISSVAVILMFLVVFGDFGHNIESDLGSDLGIVGDSLYS